MCAGPARPGRGADLAGILGISICHLAAHSRRGLQIQCPLDPSWAGAVCRKAWASVAWGNQARQAFISPNQQVGLKPYQLILILPISPTTTQGE